MPSLDGYSLNEKMDKKFKDIDDDIIDITRVEIKDTNDRYVMIPKLADSHKILKGDDV